MFVYCNVEKKTKYTVYSQKALTFLETFYFNKILIRGRQTTERELTLTIIL